MGTEVGNTKELVMENEVDFTERKKSACQRSFRNLIFCNFTLIKRLVLQIKIHCISGKS